MRASLVAAVALVALGALHAAWADDRINPVLVVRTVDPWGMVVGSESAAFALYDDGTVILQVPSKERQSDLSDSYLRRLKLDAAQVASLTATITPDLLGLEPRIRISDATDQPETTIHVWHNRKRKSLEVYGNLESAEARHLAPKAFTAVLDAIAGVKVPTGTAAWLPKTIEVLAWDYEYAPEEPMSWPEGWPVLPAAPTTARAGTESIHLGADHFRELRAMLARRGERQAILIGGKKCSVAYRLPFPREEEWMEK